MARHCPDCEIELVVEVVRDVQLDVCPDCAGTWFDPEELRTLLAQDPLVLGMLEDRNVPAVEHKAVGPSIHHCPACEFPLENFHYLYTSPVLVEACQNCGGMWVDDGELNQMQEWLHETHKPASASEEAGILLAKATVEHDKVIDRHNKLVHFFTLLQQYRPGWTGLFP